MELKVEELPLENYQNYWSGSTADNKKTPKKVSYDDILSSLNMTVHNGVLHFVNPVVSTQPTTTPTTARQSPHTPIQNSYIHNKYFKDYVEPNSAPTKKNPPTREEYLKYLYNQQQIARVKSKKLLFNTEHISVSQTQNLKDLNKMFVTPYRKK